MGFSELIIILLLCLTLLQPKDIKKLISNLTNAVTNIKKYSNTLKKNIYSYIITNFKKKN